MGALASRPRQGVRKATNVTLTEELLREAKELGVNVSQACERGLAEEVRKARAEKWLRENQAALDAWNDYVERNGLPLAELEFDALP
jgi:antitoxin CcdA